jgi:hypothetical protein
MQIKSEPKPARSSWPHQVNQMGLPFTLLNTECIRGPERWLAQLPDSVLCPSLPWAKCLHFHSGWSNMSRGLWTSFLLMVSVRYFLWNVCRISWLLWLFSVCHMHLWMVGGTSLNPSVSRVMKSVVQCLGEERASRGWKAWSPCGWGASEASDLLPTPLCCLVGQVIDVQGVSQVLICLADFRFLTPLSCYFINNCNFSCYKSCIYFLNKKWETYMQNLNWAEPDSNTVHFICLAPFLYRHVKAQNWNYPV